MRLASFFFLWGYNKGTSTFHRHIYFYSPSEMINKKQGLCSMSLCYFYNFLAAFLECTMCNGQWIRHYRTCERARTHMHVSSLLICMHWIRRLKRTLISTESKRRRKKERKTSGISPPGSLIQALPMFLVQSPCYSSLYLLNKLVGAFGCQSVRQLIPGAFKRAAAPQVCSIHSLRMNLQMQTGRNTLDEKNPAGSGSRSRFLY